MGEEVNLMCLYPQSQGRLAERPIIEDAAREISRKFDFDYFDGDRKYGYGGFNYNPKFWTETVALFSEYYAIREDARILDIGCAKGFMLKDFKRLLPLSTVVGIEISKYAVENADPEVSDYIRLGNASELGFEDQSFDLVISINTLHNLDLDNCIQALSEIERVSKGNSFVMVDGWKNAEQRKNMESWVLTAKTMMAAEDWVKIFKKAGYSGDYWFWTVT